jgi:glutamine synthetase
VEAAFEPELFLPEYGEHQFEIPVAPCAGMAAADRSVIVKEVVREVARRLGRCASFAPVREASGVGTGAHIHLGLLDESGRSVAYDPARPARRSRVASSSGRRTRRRRPTSLGDPLAALERDPVARDWLPPRLLDTYIGLERLELALVADLDEEEVCRLYAGVH